MPAEIPALHMTLKPLDRSWYGQISSGYEMTSGVLDYVSRVRRTEVCFGLQGNVITPKEDKEERNDGNAYGRVSCVRE